MALEKWREIQEESHKNWSVFLWQEDEEDRTVVWDTKWYTCAEFLERKNYRAFLWGARGVKEEGGIKRDTIVRNADLPPSRA